MLDGKVVGFDATPLTFDEEGRATEYQITITASMAFRDRAADQVLWQNDRYVYKESYAVEPGEQWTTSTARSWRSSRRRARFARTVVIDLLEGF